MGGNLTKETSKRAGERDYGETEDGDYNHRSQGNHYVPDLELF